jgi:hypothetical protein
MQLRGRVTRGPFGRGSKSEHMAVYLEAGTARYVLRRRGGNAFADPTLAELVGQEIEAEGTLVEDLFLMDSWTSAAPRSAGKRKPSAKK